MHLPNNNLSDQGIIKLYRLLIDNNNVSNNNWISSLSSNIYDDEKYFILF